MVTYSNVIDSNNVRVIDELGGFKVIEHQKDLSSYPERAVNEFFSAKMNVKKRQVLIELNNNSYVVQAGAMQWTSGNINANSGVNGVGSFFGKMVSSAVTGESAVKPEYTGTGSLMLEPTYRHIILLDVSKWGSVVLDDGLFLACDNTLKRNVVARGNVSSAVLGGEGLFNLSLSGEGIVALESYVPLDELIEIELNNDVLKIDGNMAVAWSGSLQFTVEKSGKSLVGSAVSGEGLVNVYRGTGKVLMAPVDKGSFENAIAATTATTTNNSSSNVDKVSSTVDTISNILDILS